MMIAKLAWRSLWRYRRRTLLTVSAIMVGTALALFIITMADGMYKKLVDEAVRMEAGYVTVEHRSYSEDLSIDLTVDGFPAWPKRRGRYPASRASRF